MLLSFLIDPLDVFVLAFDIAKIFLVDDLLSDVILFTFSVDKSTVVVS